MWLMTDEELIIALASIVILFIGVCYVMLKLHRNLKPKDDLEKCEQDKTHS